MEKYIPTSLKNSIIIKHKEAFAIGIRKGNENAMLAGPFPTLKEALEWIGNPGEKIYHFFSDGSTRTEWAWHGGGWVNKVNTIN
jgi:hypothetical protein